jgi:hypothetical protein
MMHTGVAWGVYLHLEGVWRATGGESIAHYLASGATFRAVRPLECVVKSPQRSSLSLAKDPRELLEHSSSAFETRLPNPRKPPATSATTRARPRTLSRRLLRSVGESVAARADV